MTLMHGLRGAVMLANGIAGAPLSVPRSGVRFRFVNAANARVFNLSLSDGRTMHWIGTDGGLLERPVPLDRLLLAPGQRAEVLVDLSDGHAVDLVTARDPTARAMTGGGGMMGRMGGTGGPAMRGEMGDPLSAPAQVLHINRTNAREGRSSCLIGSAGRDLIPPRVPFAAAFG